MQYYRAFISYNHRADDRLAPALQSALRRIAKPWYRLPAFRIYRDKSGATPPILWDAIEEALSRSDYFLLMASPGAAQSPWVSKEVGWWIKNRSLRNLIIVLTDGELAWSDIANDFDRPRSTAINECLFGRIEREPLYVDLRWARPEQSLSLRHSRFRAAVLDIAAPLYDKPRDALDDEDVRHSRFARRLAAIAITLLAAFAVATGFAARMAQQQRERAQQSAAEARAGREAAELRQREAEHARIREEVERQRAVAAAAEAVRQRDLAICRQLAVQAGALLEERLDLGLLLASETRRLYSCPEISSSLLRALQHQPRIQTFLTQDAEGMQPGLDNVITAVAFSPDGTKLAASSEGSTLIWDVKSRKRIGKRLTAGYGLAFTPDGNTLLASDGRSSVLFWDMTSYSAAAVPLLLAGEGMVTSVEVSPNGKLFAVETGVTAPWQVSLWDLVTRKHLGLQIYGHGHAFSPDGRLLATSSENHVNIVLWDVNALTVLGEPLKGHTKDIRCLAFSRDGRKLVSGGEDNLVIVWDLKTRRGTPLTGHIGPVNEIALSHDGRILATAGGDRRVILWDSETLQPYEPLVDGSGPISSVAFSPDDRILASTSADNRVILWNVESRTQLGHAFAVQKAGPSNIAFSPNGRTLAARV